MIRILLVEYNINAVALCRRLQCKCWDASSFNTSHFMMLLWAQVKRHISAICLPQSEDILPDVRFIGVSDS